MTAYSDHVILVHVAHHVHDVTFEVTAYLDHVVLVHFGHHVQDSASEEILCLDQVILVSVRNVVLGAIVCSFLSSCS